MKNIILGTITYIFLYLTLEVNDHFVSVSENIKLVFGFLFVSIASYIGGMRVLYPILAINLLLFGYSFYILHQIALPADANARYLDAVFYNAGMVIKYFSLILLGCITGAILKKVKNIKKRCDEGVQC